jgi:hypothetical protein
MRRRARRSAQPLEVDLPPLNGVRWSELSHAYGFAGDIEPLLQSLYDFPPESQIQAEPWHTLWSSLCHQGDVYSASFAAVPVILDALATRPRSATLSYFQLPVCIELARVAHRFEVPANLEKPYFAAITRLPVLVAEASAANWDADMTAVASAAIAVAKGQWNIAELLVNIEPGDYAEVLSWYQSR